MKKLLTILFAMLFLTACDEVTHYDYKFIGEGEHWEAEYDYSGTETWGDRNGTKTYSNEDSYEFTLKYKGELGELSTLKKLEYSYETNTSAGGGTREFTEPPKDLIYKNEARSGNGAKVMEDEVVKVKVKWDDFEESFELHNKEK